MLHLYVLLTNFITRPLKKDEGATAVEYGLLVTVIALVMVAGAILLGNALNELFGDAADQVGPAAPAPAP